MWENKGGTSFHERCFPKKRKEQILQTILGKRNNIPLDVIRALRWLVVDIGSNLIFANLPTLEWLLQFYSQSILTRERENNTLHLLVTVGWIFPPLFSLSFQEGKKLTYVGLGTWNFTSPTRVCLLSTFFPGIINLLPLRLLQYEPAPAT